MDIRHIPASQADFPDCLRHIPDPPAEIFVLGDLQAILELPKLAIVGSRKPTPYGRLATTQLAGETARRGIAIVSGLALGIDALAHRVALDAGGLTIAVLGSPLDQISPSGHYWLAQEILKRGGALVSEYPPGAEIFKLNFVERNRLVAGLSNGVLITEAAARSGSSHTAHFALDQGKPVLAVPGNINSPLSEGTNNLIKTGALPATDIKDILLALGLTDLSNRQSRPLGSTPAENAILELIQSGVTKAADLLDKSRLKPHVFCQTLSMLEITGLVYPLGGGQWGIK